MIDSVINYKANDAKSGQIYFLMNVLVPQELELDSVAICRIIGNALDNAIEATEKSRIWTKGLCG